MQMTARITSASAAMPEILAELHPEILAACLAVDGDLLCHRSTTQITSKNSAINAAVVHMLTLRSGSIPPLCSYRAAVGNISLEPVPPT